MAPSAKRPARMRCLDDRLARPGRRAISRGICWPARCAPPALVRIKRAILAASPCSRKSSSPTGAKSPAGSSRRRAGWASPPWLSIPKPTAPRCTSRWRTRRSASGRRRPRNPTSTSRASSPPAAKRARRRCTPATASSPSARPSPRLCRRPASSSSAPTRAPSRRWATRSNQRSSPPPPGSRRCRATSASSPTARRPCASPTGSAIP